MGTFFYYVGAHILAFAIVGAVLAGSAVVAPQIAFYLYFGWQVFDAVFLAGPTAVFTPAKALALFMVILYLISLGKVRQRILVSKSIIIVMLLFGFWGLLISPLAIAYIVALKNSAQVVVQVILIAGAIHFLDSRKRVFSAFFWCFLGGVIAGAIMIIGGGISEQYGRGTLGEYANPNTTALALSVSLIALPGLWISKKPKIYYLVYAAGVVVILIAMLMTGSRASLVAVFMALGFGGLFARGTGVFKRFLIPAAIIVLIGGAVLYVLSLNILQEKSQERLEEMVYRQRIEALRENRTAIWGKVLATYANQNPMFGFGFGNTAFAMLIYQGEYRDVHSSLIGPLVDSGPVGFVLFPGGLFLLFMRIRGIKNTRMSVIATMIYMLILLSSLTHTIHFTKWFWIPVTMCLLLVEQSKREEYADYAVTQEWEPELPLRM